MHILLFTCTFIEQVASTLHRIALGKFITLHCLSKASRRRGAQNFGSMNAGEIGRERKGMITIKTRFSFSRYY